MGTNPAHRFLTAKDVAERFQVSTRVVYSWVDQGKLPALRVGARLIRFTEEHIEEFIRECREQWHVDDVAVVLTRR